MRCGLRPHDTFDRHYPRGLAHRQHFRGAPAATSCRASDLMLQCRGTELAPLPPSAQGKAAANSDDATHTPNDDSSRMDSRSSRSLAEALSALMSMVPDATDSHGRPADAASAAAAALGSGVGVSTCAPAAGTPANSSDEESSRNMSSSDEEGTARGRARYPPQLKAGRGTPEGGVTHREPGSAMGASNGADGESYFECIRYLQQLPNGAALAAALTRRLEGTKPQLATVADPKTRTFYVAPQASDDAARRARLVALVKYKRKREQQQLHPQVRYKSRKKIADNRVRRVPPSPHIPRNLFAQLCAAGRAPPPPLASIISLVLSNHTLETLPSTCSCLYRASFGLTLAFVWLRVQPRVKGRFIKTVHCIKSSGDAAAAAAAAAEGDACEESAEPTAGASQEEESTDESSGETTALAES